MFVYSCSSAPFRFTSIVKVTQIASNVKLRFQSDSAASKIKQALHHHGLSSTIRLIFQAQPPLARLLAPAKENIEYPTNCITCKLCEKQNQCKQKGETLDAICVTLTILVKRNGALEQE